MRIRILSDLHREFGPTEIPAVGGDVDLVVLAGDIDIKVNALGWIREFTAGVPAAYVCGNHEFYGDKLPRVREKLQEATAGTNVHVLEDSHFTTADGWHIYGCTLWTGMALNGDWQVGAAEAGAWMNDYKRVRNSARGYRKLTPLDTRNIHLLSVLKMEAFFETHDPARTVVVTHHAPSILSLPEPRREKLISCAYASRMEDFILKHQQPLWIHGHIHHANDYQIGKTRVIANPQAYPMEGRPGCVAVLVVEV